MQTTGNSTNTIVLQEIVHKINFSRDNPAMPFFFTQIAKLMLWTGLMSMASFANPNNNCLERVARRECDSDTPTMLEQCAKPCIAYFETDPGMHNPIVSSNMLSLAEMIASSTSNGNINNQILSSVLIERASILDQNNCLAMFKSANTKFNLFYEHLKGCSRTRLSPENNLIHNVLDGGETNNNNPPIICTLSIAEMEVTKIVKISEKAQNCSASAATKLLNRKQSKNKLKTFEKDRYNALKLQLDSLSLLSRVYALSNQQELAARIAEEAARLVEPESFPILWVQAAQRMRQSIGDHTKFKELSLTLASETSYGNGLLSGHLALPLMYHNQLEEDRAVALFTLGLSKLQTLIQKSQVLDHSTCARFVTPPPTYPLAYLFTDQNLPSIVSAASDVVRSLHAYQLLDEGEGVGTVWHSPTSANFMKDEGNNENNKQKQEYDDDEGTEDNDKAYRVGFLSTRVWNHAIGRMLIGVLREVRATIDRAQKSEPIVREGEAPWLSDLQSMEVVLIDGTEVSVSGDPARAFMWSLADEVVPISFQGGDIPEVAREVMDLDLDVLVFTDIGLEWPTYLLSQNRMAPIQMVMHGHPVSPGSKMIDMFVSFDEFEPPCDAQDYYAETLITLPRLQQRPFDVKQIESNQLATSEEIRKKLNIKHVDAPLVVSLQLFEKMIPSSDDTWATLLLSNENIHLVFLTSTWSTEVSSLQTLLNSDPYSSHEEVSEGIRTMFLERMRASLERIALENSCLKQRRTSGIDECNKDLFGSAAQLIADHALERLILTPMLHPTYYHALLKEATVVLDSYPFGGFATTLDALLMGSPVVTRKHPFNARGRASAALINRMAEAMPYVLTNHSSQPQKSTITSCTNPPTPFSSFSTSSSSSLTTEFIQDISNNQVTKKMQPLKTPKTSKEPKLYQSRDQSTIRVTLSFDSGEQVRYRFPQTYEFEWSDFELGVKERGGIDVEASIQCTVDDGDVLIRSVFDIENGEKIYVKVLAQENNADINEKRDYDDVIVGDDKVPNTCPSHETIEFFDFREHLIANDQASFVKLVLNIVENEVLRSNLTEHLLEALEAAVGPSTTWGGSEDQWAHLVLSAAKVSRGGPPTLLDQWVYAMQPQRRHCNHTPQQ